MASTVLSRSVSSTGEIKKATFSVWLKKSKSTGEQFMFYSYENNNNNFRFRFNPEIIEAKTLQGGSTAMQVVTNRKFQDTSAWYHILLAMDSTQATAADRIKIYVNGVQETSLSTETYPSQNSNLSVNENGSTVYIGAQVNSNYFDGYMTHLYYIDGTAYTPSTFGETDSTTGEWKIKTSPSLTYGTNGFSILKDGAGITDLSGNGNNLTASGTLTAAKDNPSDNFPTWNNMFYRQFADKGACEITPDGDGDQSYSISTLGAADGKYYFEFESNGGNGRALVGMVNSDWATEQLPNNQEPGANAYSFAYRQNQGDIQMNSSTSTYGTQITWGTSGNVLMMAVDLDNNKVWYGVDGTWQNSGDPANGTNGFDFSAVRVAGEPYLVLVGDDTSSGYGNIQANFGNGLFGTDSVASAQNPGTGNTSAIFEYTVPTGFTAMTTKGINS